jgi:hypothetical protein
VLDVGLMGDWQAYNGEATPFGPTALLLSMWKASAELAGHEQQGALLPQAGLTRVAYPLYRAQMHMRFSSPL